MLILHQGHDCAYEIQCVLRLFVGEEKLTEVEEIPENAENFLITIAKQTEWGDFRAKCPYFPPKWEP